MAAFTAMGRVPLPVRRRERGHVRHLRRLPHLPAARAGRRRPDAAIVSHGLSAAGNRRGLWAAARLHRPGVGLDPSSGDPVNASTARAPPASIARPAVALAPSGTPSVPYSARRLAGTLTLGVDRGGADAYRDAMDHAGRSRDCGEPRMGLRVVVVAGGQERRHGSRWATDSIRPTSATSRRSARAPAGARRAARTPGRRR